MGDSTVIKRLRDAFHEFRRDLWPGGMGLIATIVWVFGLLASAILICLESGLTTSDTACLPDGSFRLHSDTYSMWSSSGFFQITLGGGKLSFAQAKAVDVVWDIGIGRGGQLLLALISWHEFAKYLTLCMESEPVTYRVFRTVFVETDVSIISTFRMIKNFVLQRRLRSRTAMLFMVGTMLFILAFPTLTSAMSGYDANVASRILDRDDNLVPFSSFSKGLYMIHDGSRINRSNDFWVMASANGYDPVPSAASSDDIIKHVSLYVATYGIGGTRNITSDFTGKTNITLNAPILNITAYTKDTRYGGYNLSGVLDMMWLREGETFDYAYIKANGKCQNTGDYQWGFSFLQLFLCIILLLAWTIGTCVMWIYTNNTMALRNRLAEEISGEYRAVLELAAAMHTDLNIEEADDSMLREAQLKERIDKEIRGGTIAYAYPNSTLKAHSIRDGFKTWIKTNPWWIMGFLATTFLCSVSWAALGYGSSVWAWIWLWSIWLGQVWAFFAGTTVGSRLLMILVCSVVGGLVVAVSATAVSTATMLHMIQPFNFLAED